MTQHVILRGNYQRKLAKELIDKAPDNAVVRISEAKRSLEQNSKLWAMLSDISRAKPEGRMHTPEMWKALFMNACGHEVQFLNGLEGGNPFPVGFSSSRLKVSEMRDLIDFIDAYGARHNVKWSEAQ